MDLCSRREQAPSVFLFLSSRSYITAPISAHWIPSSPSILNLGLKVGDHPCGHPSSALGTINPQSQIILALNGYSDTWKTSLRKSPKRNAGWLSLAIETPAQISRRLRTPKTREEWMATLRDAPLPIVAPCGIF